MPVARKERVASELTGSESACLCAANPAGAGSSGDHALGWFLFLRLAVARESSPSILSQQRSAAQPTSTARRAKWGAGERRPEAIDGDPCSSLYASLALLR